jgi:hypothetical protein
MSRGRREQRAELTKQALADVVRVRVFERRFQQTTVAGRSGISRSHLRALLRAEKQMSLFIFLELSEALRFDDACQFLRCVLDRRDQHLRDAAEEDQPTAPISTLHEEIDTYIRHLPELLRNQGKFVLIKGTEVAGTFDSYQDALTAGYQRFKLASFLVKQIVAVERIGILPRMLR